jgi:hypothetical protein
MKKAGSFAGLSVSVALRFQAAAEVPRSAAIGVTSGLAFNEGSATASTSSMRLA